VVERAIERDNVGVRAVVTQHNNLCPVLFQVACMSRRWVDVVTVTKMGEIA
jgi:hypothetical protein